MFSENLKTLRKSKGLSQEELAIRLNVVRQTISKWEKGLSVPDADLLIRIADIFEVSVSQLLGAKLDNERDIGVVAEQLSRINEQLAIKNRRSHRIWKTVAIIVIAFVVINIILILLSMASFRSYENGKTSANEIHGSAELAENSDKQPILDLLRTKAVDVTHYVGGKEEKWSITDKKEIEQFSFWLDSLSLELKYYEKGNSPGDSNGGEVYMFTSDNGEFSYKINSSTDCYILYDSEWYQVKNPVDPFGE